MNEDQADGGDLGARAVELERQRRELEAEQQRLDEATKQRELELQQADLAHQRAELDRKRAELEQQQARPVPIADDPAGGIARERERLELERQQLERDNVAVERERLENERRDLATATASAPIDPAPRLNTEMGAPTTLRSEPKDRRGVVMVACGLAALAIGAAAGWFGYDFINDDSGTEQVAAEGQPEEISTPTATDAPAATTATTTPTAALNIVKPFDSSFQVGFPEGWTAGWRIGVDDSGYAYSVLPAEPDWAASLTADHNPYVLGRMFVARYSRESASFVEIIDVFGPDQSCTAAAGPEPFSFGDLVGQRYRYTDCGGVDAERWRVGFEVDDQTVLYASVQSSAGESPEAAMAALLSTLTTEVAADTPVAPPEGCLDTPDSSDPEFSLVATFVNTIDASVFVQPIDPATGQPAPDAWEWNIPFGEHRFNTNNAGARYSFVLPDSSVVDYDWTADPRQCILISWEGLVAG